MEIARHTSLRAPSSIRGHALFRFYGSPLVYPGEVFYWEHKVPGFDGIEYRPIHKSQPSNMRHDLKSFLLTASLPHWLYLASCRFLNSFMLSLLCTCSFLYLTPSASFAGELEGILSVVACRAFSDSLTWAKPPFSVLPQFFLLTSKWRMKHTQWAIIAYLQSLIYSFSKCLSNAYNMPGAGPGGWNMSLH